MARRPNILLLMTDQQRWDAMSCSGTWVQTPHMDRIAAQGVRFSNCVTNSPVCVPARLSLATGLYPHNTGVWQNCGSRLDPRQSTWMQAVRRAGYRTSLFGKTHLHPHQGDLRLQEDLMNAYGLDDVDEIGGPRASARVLSHMTALWQDKGKWDDYRDDYAERFANKPYVVRPSTLGLEDYADAYVGRRACEYIEAYDRDEPFCCWVSFGGPHEPWDTPQPYASQYDPASMPAPAPIPVDAAERPAGGLDELCRRQNYDLQAEEITQMRADYAGNISLIDDQIGRILEVLEKRGALDNTVIALVSDHGEMNGDCGLIYKENFLDGAVRVPLLLRTPQSAAGHNAGQVSQAPVEWFDVGPTLIELAGTQVDYPQFARSLCPLLQDTQSRIRDEALSELKGEYMLLDETWKAAFNAQGEIYLLFDVYNDPSESQNLAGLPTLRPIETQMRRRLLHRLAQSQLNGTPYYTSLGSKD